MSDNYSWVQITALDNQSRSILEDEGFWHIKINETNFFFFLQVRTCFLSWNKIRSSPFWAETKYALLILVSVLVLSVKNGIDASLAETHDHALITSKYLGMSVNKASTFWTTIYKIDYEMLTVWLGLKRVKAPKRPPIAYYMKWI